MNKKALSPLVATVLLVVFALVIGTLTMNWGKNYVEKTNEQEEATSSDSSMVISLRDITAGNSALKELMIKYITGSLSEEQYLKQQEKLVAG